MFFFFLVRPRIRTPIFYHYAMNLKSIIRTIVLQPTCMENAIQMSTGDVICTACAANRQTAELPTQDAKNKAILLRLSVRNVGLSTKNMTIPERFIVMQQFKSTTCIANPKGTYPPPPPKWEILDWPDLLSHRNLKIQYNLETTFLKPFSVG